MLHFTEKESGSVNVKLLFIQDIRRRSRRKKAVDAREISENNHLSLSTLVVVVIIVALLTLIYLSSYLRLSSSYSSYIHVVGCSKSSQNSNIPTLATIFVKYAYTHLVEDCEDVIRIQILLPSCCYCLLGVIGHKNV